MTNSADDFLFGGGGVSATFETLGDSISGTIASTEVRQQTDMKTGALETWDNGDPKMQLVVTLQTALRDPSIANDDGKRNVYIKGSKKPGSQSAHDAVATAVKAAGASNLAIGGTLTLQYVGSVPSETKGFNDRKLWAASYVAPAAGFLGVAQPVAAPAVAQPVQQVAQPAPVAQPVAVPAAVQQIAQPVAAAPVGHSPAVLAALTAAGVDPATVPVQPV